ncbi:MAG: hypothetical protein AB7L66_20080 [Gemmatimonadales bacterium]
MFDQAPRRGFLAGLGTLAVGLAGGRRLWAEGQAPVDTNDRWVTGLKGKHRQLFDFNVHADGTPLIHMRNYIETLKSAYRVPAADINAVGTFYGSTTPLAWNDAMWEKYEIGAALQIKDPATNAPITRNWFAKARAGDPVFRNGRYADAAIESLAEKGALFLLCNNALGGWVGQLVAAGHGTADAIRADLLSNLVPRTVVVPAMVIAVGVAQRHGLTYMRT